MKVQGWTLWAGLIDKRLLHLVCSPLPIRRYVCLPECWPCKLMWTLYIAGTRGSSPYLPPAQSLDGIKKAFFLYNSKWFMIPLADCSQIQWYDIRESTSFFFFYVPTKLKLYSTIYNNNSQTKNFTIYTKIVKSENKTITPSAVYQTTYPTDQPSVEIVPLQSIRSDRDRN